MDKNATLKAAPSEGADFSIRKRRSRLGILMLVENAFPNDTRVKNEADALTTEGFSVVVVALRKEGQIFAESIDGVQVYRLPRVEFFEKIPRENPTTLENFAIKFKSLFGYLTEYLYFTIACLLISIYIGSKHRLDVIHAHNPPDTLFLVALPWKLFRKKFVYDQHDLCPELYRSRYSVGRDFLAEALGWIEWANLKLANVTIATNESYKNIQIERGGCKSESIFVVRNGPNQSRMQVTVPCPRLSTMGKRILVYVGSLNPQDGVDYLLRALKHLVVDLKRTDFYCVIMGTGDSIGDLQRMVVSFNLENFVELTGWVADEELQAKLAAADICMDPDPSNPLNDVSTWIKIMEYMACGKPIVAFDLKETRYSAQDAALFVPCNDELAFAQATELLMDDAELRDKMGRFGRDRVEKDLQWSVVSRELIAAYESLEETKCAR